MLAILTLIWWLPVSLCLRRASLQLKRDVFIAQWKKHFEENVAGQWLFYDGVGN